MTGAEGRAGVVPQDSPAPKRPWLKFFPSDWRGDPLLATCSLEARGLLIELIGLMHAAEPYGHLLVNRAAPADSELTRLVNARSVTELRRVRQELLDHGVLSQNADGVLYSRRMIRDAKNAVKKREDGKKGGNPRLLGTSGPSDEGAFVHGDAGQHLPSEVNHEVGIGVNHDVKPGVKPHIPDAIFQNPLPPSGVVGNEEIEEIAGRFLEGYPVVYARRRSGATYRIRRPRDLAYARDLAKAWPDVDRLLAMLEVFLCRPDIGEKNKPGTPGQFLHMAPDCDRLLKEHGR